MNLHALRLFHHVAELGSVTKAAERLNLSQPAVTGQIKKLERELGLQLLSPQGRGILLTEVGLKLSRDAGRLFSLEARIEQTIDDYRQGGLGSLRIAATYLPANFLLPSLIADYKKQNAGIDLRFTATSSANAIELLLRFEADIAFIGGSQHTHPLLDRTLWHEDELWFVARKDHPFAGRRTTLAEIVEEPFVFREQGSYAREQLQALCAVKRVPMPNGGLQMNGFGELLRVVSEGYGIAFLSASEARDGLERGALKRIYVEDVKLMNPIFTYSRKEPLSAQAVRFMDLLADRRSG
ncbi:LysR family transcriptional regulator [Cohnella endophytica]|uniref:LysR family transcriptional regulator n=1 Tax=Cohnella endophytica TaxID=2419778 RepID=A0A494XCN2_9BACL|nr:LysR family transcriptional regulator [Cohnella endophytica]